MAQPISHSLVKALRAVPDFQSLDDARGVVERYKRFYRTSYLKSYLVGNRKQRQWMVMACKLEGVMPTTEGGLDTKLDLGPDATRADVLKAMQGHIRQKAVLVGRFHR